MGKKYIIELEDKPFHKEDGDFLYRVKGFNSLVFDMTGIGMLTPYTEPDLEQVRKEAYQKGYETGYEDGYNEPGKNRQEEYQRGLVDAWKAAKKIALMDTETSENVTGYFGLFRIMENLTPMQAIEKIRQYEQEKEEKQHTWICSEVNEPSVDTTLICSECGYAIKIKPHETPELNFCPKCGDCKKPKEEET